MSILLSLSHHATLFVNEDRKKFTDSLWSELQKDSIAHTLHNKTVLDIDTARALTSWSNTPYEGTKIALLSFHTATLPAQNALLKILEEPRNGVRFILVTSNQELLIPTLYSRLQYRSTKDIPIYNKEAELFLATESSARMKLPYISSLLTAKDEEGRKDREGVRMFIVSLVELLHANKVEERYILSTTEVASYAGESSSSGKALLEYLALLLPQIKA